MELEKTLCNVLLPFLAYVTIHKNGKSWLCFVFGVVAYYD